MTREDRIKLAIERGYTYDPITGKIFSRFGKEIKRKVKGYISINILYNKRNYTLYGHQFAYYYKYGKVVECIDHKDGNRSNNIITNLRVVTMHQNQHNRTGAKGYYFNKNINKYTSYIGVNSKVLYIGSFNTELEARQAYLEAKKIYHNISE